MNPEHGHEGGTGRREEAALSTVLRDAAGDLMPNTPALVSGGVARGKRMRVARRAQVAVAAAAVVALGGAGMVALGDLGGGGGTTVAAPGSSGAATPAPTPPQALAAPTLTARQAADALKQLLPAGAVVEEVTAYDPATGGGGEVGVTLRVDADRLGAGAVTLIISSGNSPGLECFDDTGLNASCDLVPQADGSQLRLEKNWERPATPTTEDDKPGVNGGGARVWSAWAQRADGIRIYVSASSAADEKGQETREAPALTIEQLKAVATAPVWATLATPESVPQPTKGRYGTPAAPDPSAAVPLTTG